MEGAAMADLHRRVRSIQEDSCGVSYNQSTSSSQPEAGSERDKFNASKCPNRHLQHDTRWWLRMQPDLDQQLNALETEVSTLPPSDHQSRDFVSENLDYLDAVYTEKLSPEMELMWMGSEKAGPWWRNVGKDELASLVAQKSLDYIENCDLPQPHMKHLREQASDSLDSVDRKELISSAVDCRQNIPASSSIDGRGCIDRKGLDGSSSHSETTNQDQTNPQKGPTDKFSTIQLLEALCHSQTRARKAEEAAQQAYNEKEHIVALFFRQASHLFAYRQWLHLLQLETSFYLQPRNGNLPSYDIFPGIVDSIPEEGKTQMNRKPCKSGKRRRQGKQRSSIAVAVGLGFAGAGFLLGWTMGWLLFSPT